MATYQFVPITLRQWADDFLAAVGAPRTPDNEQLIVAWERAESDQSGRSRVASWNPLNTTNRAAGSSSFNSVGVQNFPDLRTGVEENAKALVTSGYYPTILRGLQAGNPALALSNPREWSTWGTGAGIQSALASVQSDWPHAGDTQLANATPVQTGSGLDPIGSFEDLYRGLASDPASAANLGTVVAPALGPLNVAAASDVLGLASGSWQDQIKRLVLIAVFALGGLALVTVGVFRASAPVREPIQDAAGKAGAAAAVAA